MQFRTIVIFSLILLLTASLFLGLTQLTKPIPNETTKVFVGVDIAYNDLAASQKLINQVSSSVNLIVIGNTGITWDVAKVDELCQYIYDRGLYFIYFTGPSDGMANQGEWVDSARARWGSKFLGLYMYDEWGGKQLDVGEQVVAEAANYSDAATQFVENVRSMFVLDQGVTHAGNLTTFTSDYTLYWFDYKVGYDVILTQFGWNYSRQLNIALCRGAATAFNKDWGAIVTWTYTHPPYIESGDVLYDDMVLAYRNGAKYILVFDSDYDYTNEILEEQHLDAFRRFRDYMNSNPQPVESPSERVGFVLPKDYGYGFRGPNDKIWGLWEADNLSQGLSVKVNSMLEEYGTKLDIIYDEGIPAGGTMGYSKLVFWNGTVIERNP
jgi:hypothetical protein